MGKKPTYEELVTRVRDLEQRLETSTDLDQHFNDKNSPYRLMLENISDTVIVSTDEGRLVYVCPNSMEIFGLTHQEVLSLNSIQNLMNGSICSVSDLVDHSELKNIEWSITNSSGDIRHLLINVKKVNINIGTILYVMRDITDRINAEQNLEASEKKYRLAMEATSDGVWDWDIATGNTYYSDGWCKILDEKSVPPTFDSWKDRLHSRDRCNALSSLQLHLEDKTPQWSSEHRLKTGNKDYKWVLARGRVIEKDALGAPIRMVGTLTDIANKKKIESSLIESVNKWKNILLKTPQIGIALDTKANIIFANDQFLSLTGWERQEIINKNWFDLFIPEAVRETVRSIFDTTMSQKDILGFSTYENEILTRSGETLNVVWYNVLTKNNAGNVVDVTCLGIDLTEKNKAEEKLQGNIYYLENLSKIDKIIRHGTDAEKVMGDVLGAVLDIFDCDRASLVYPCDPHAEFWTVPYERTSQEFPGSYSKNAKHYMTPGVARDMTELLENDKLQFGTYTHNLPDYDIENEFSIKSYLAMRFFQKATNLGNLLSINAPTEEPGVIGN